jgi:hypothetical protein
VIASSLKRKKRGCHQLIGITYSPAVSRHCNWPYHANIVNTLELGSSMIDAA